MASVRNILITGGNGGMGLAIAKYFLASEPQSTVWLGVRAHRSAAESLAAEQPDRCKLLTLDVCQPEEWRRAVEAITAEDGQQLEVLVNNAGMHRDGLLATMADEDWHQVIASNLDSVFFGCRAAIPAMMRHRCGRIINLASLSAVLPPIGQTNYAAAKAGVVTLTQTLAKETARAGITVNAVLPGYIETEALADFDLEARRAAAKRVPMRRFGKPEEVASAVVFLASADASYITGASLKIDGGIF